MNLNDMEAEIRRLRNDLNDVRGNIRGLNDVEAEIRRLRNDLNDVRGNIRGLNFVVALPYIVVVLIFVLIKLSGG